ncbi:unnamed protein product [Ectocarpus sp. 12 AP-2014]
MTQKQIEEEKQTHQPSPLLSERYVCPRKLFWGEELGSRSGFHQRPPKKAKDRKGKAGNCPFRSTGT